MGVDKGLGAPSGFRLLPIFRLARLATQFEFLLTFRTFLERKDSSVRKLLLRLGLFLESRTRPNFELVLWVETLHKLEPSIFLGSGLLSGSGLLLETQ